MRCYWDVEWGHCHGWWLLSKPNIMLSYDLSLPLRRSRRSEQMFRRKLAKEFTASPFTVANNSKQLKSPTDEWIDAIVYLYIEIYFTCYSVDEA